MAVFGGIVRAFSFLFHLLLALFMLGLSSLAFLNGSINLNLAMLPWEGTALNYWLLFSALAGIIFVLLAIKGKLPVLFFLWSVAVFLMLVRGYFLSPYNFAHGGLATATYLTVGSLLAVVGSWLQFRRVPSRAKHRVAV